MNVNHTWIAQQNRLTMKPGFGFLLTAAAISIVGGLLVSSLSLVALGICIYICFVYDVDGILDMLMFILPISPIFKLGGVSGFACYNILLLVAFFQLMVMCGMSFFFPSTECLLFLLYVLFGLGRADITAVIRFVVQMIICMQVLGEPALRKKINFKRKNTMLAIGIVISSFAGVLHDFFPGLRRLYLEYGSTIKLGSGVYFNRFMGVEMNPNMYTVLLSVSIAVYCVYFIIGRMQKMDWILLVALIVFGLMTVSMSFILTLGMTAGVALMIVCRRNPSLVLYIVPAVMIGAVILMGTSLGQSVLGTIMFRFENQMSSESGLDALTTGRSDFWMQYIDYFLTHPFKTLIGAGLNANLDGLPNSHNYYLETVYYFGLIGTFLYISSLFSIFSPRNYTKQKPELYVLMPFICILIRGMARNLICEEKLLLAYMLSTFAAYDAHMGTCRKIGRS